MKLTIDKEREKRENKIRRRTSYQNFKKYYEEIHILAKEKKLPEVLDLIHEIIDNYRGFRSQTRSNDVMESIVLLKKDLKQLKLNLGKEGNECRTM